MNSRQLARLGLGLIGVWALLDALTLFTQIASNLESLGSEFLFVAAVPVVLLLGLSYVLVFHSAGLAATIAPDADEGAASDHGTPDLARILVALLGVMLLVQAIPRTLNLILAFFAAGEFPVAPNLVRPIGNFIGDAVQVAIAIYLIMRPDRLVEYLRRPRPAQTD